jgi:hypothetical protein
MKRVYEADLPVDTDPAPSAKQEDPEHLLFVLVPRKWSHARKTLDIPDDAFLSENLFAYEYQVGSANPKIDLDEVLNDLFLEHGRGDVNGTVLPMLLTIASGEENDSICRLPKALSELASLVSSPNDFGTWEHQAILEIDYTSAFSDTSYASVFFVSYDSAVFAHIAEEEGLDKSE